LNRLTGHCAFSADVFLAVTVDSGHLYVQENEEPRQELFAESPLDFYSANSSDEYTFTSSDDSPAQILVLHLDGGKNLELKRVQ
jgi:hypothetical protein